MAHLTGDDHRTDLINRLKRAEGQLRGIQRMISAGDSCIEIADQMAAVRKAMDSAQARMTTSFLEESLHDRELDGEHPHADLQVMLRELQALLGKLS